MNKGGYTLIEVSLFLAISGMLTLVAIVGIGPRLTNVRFSAGMRDIQNNLTKELSSSSLGHSTNSKIVTCSDNPLGSATPPDGSAGGQNSSCVLAGKIAIVRATKIEYRDIVATADIVPGYWCNNSESGSFDQVKKCYKPRIVTDAIQPAKYYTFPSGIVRTYPDTDQAYGFIKSPENNSTFHFYITEGFGWSIGFGASLDNDYIKYNTTDSTYPACFKLSNRSAKLILQRDASNSNLEINGTCP